MGHLLVTNDFPPKLGGIQTYLHELWRRLPAGSATVYTTAYEGAEEFDRRQAFPIVRSERSVLLPSPAIVRKIDDLAAKTSSGLVMLDPALPIGLIGPKLERRYGVVLHGAEVTVPRKLPASRQLLSHVLSSASVVIAAGGYPATEASLATRGRLGPVVEVPPGVDTERFKPLSAGDRREARLKLGLPPDGLLVVSISRLVPRKGMDVLIRAVARLRPAHRELVLAIGGSGRDERRLRALAEKEGVPVSWLGRIADEDLPLAYGAADVYAMCCRDRWLGLEQEGFGIVFLEAAAAGVPQLAGLSGGSAEAVEDGKTGYVVREASDWRAVAGALEPLLADETLRERFGQRARERALERFSYDHLAGQLAGALRDAGG